MSRYACLLSGVWGLFIFTFKHTLGGTYETLTSLLPKEKETGYTQRRETSTAANDSKLSHTAQMKPVPLSGGHL